MADVRSFKPQLSSSRMFSYVKGESKDFSDKKVDDKFYNKMTSSYESQEYLQDSMQFSLTAPLIYQLDLLKEDIDDIHAHLSESKFTDRKQKFPVVDVTKEFYVTGTTLLEGDTTIEGFTNIKGAFQVNGSEISNLKPALDLADALRTKTIVSSSAQLASDISGSFTSLSASIATDIGNAGGGTVDTALKNGSTNAVTNNAVFDGLALKLNLAGGTMTGLISPIVQTVNGAKLTNPHDVRVVDIIEIAAGGKAWTLTNARSAHSGQKLTIIALTAGTIVHGAGNAANQFQCAAGKNLTVAIRTAVTFITNSNGIWYQVV